MSRRATAQDVADLAGVSRSAVSLVLNGRAKGLISAAKQEAVLDAARRLEYTPNAVAQSLRTSRTRILGVLTWRGVGGLPLHLMASALQTSLNSGYKLIKMYAEPTEIDQRRALSTLGNQQVDGMLVVAPELCEYAAVEALSASPVVLLNCQDPEQRLTSVAPDEEGAGRGAVEALLDRGHRDIALLSGPLTHFQTGLRAAGAAQALVGAGIAPRQVAADDLRIDEGLAAATALLTADRPPTALVCTNERLAVGVMLAAARLGLTVPDDLSLVSLDDREQLSAQLSPEVTRMERPDDLMATHAAELLIEWLDSGSAPEAQHYSFVCPLVAGASVAGPRPRG
ncbi:transcriptional regulator, LacI family [Friedmanniella luteola]|uniref:Transcriptional regulator, LacI family n=1 Tax=Friedmanniella luteola TaxID=546871 RepID=A0A1H1MJA7_9ACTN|nr:LacI family DNA-binding transcriptional regulator [Friedmanniella luteola]SDR86720.1 transcriptional regulator, LacI family [Friedmanniella luteola]